MLQPPSRSLGISLVDITVWSNYTRSHRANIIGSDCMIQGTLICILCLGVFLQILGAPLTFSSLETSNDPFDESILIGFAILSGPSSSFSETSFSRVGQHPGQLHPFVYVIRFFRPPLISA
jgi:hypothetical protein